MKNNSISGALRNFIQRISHRLILVGMSTEKDGSKTFVFVYKGATPIVVEELQEVCRLTSAEAKVDKGIWKFSGKKYGRSIELRPRPKAEYRATFRNSSMKMIDNLPMWISKEAR